MNKDGGWIFISHSHLDIDIVRKIRNQLEERGFEPLIFFLKCLNDDNEIESLIKREINAREWFIYVESDNAASSRWVKSEREYIAQLSGKKVFTIDINSDISKQIEGITKQLKVFISYAHKDRKVYEIIKQALLSRDFLVFDDNYVTIRGDLQRHIQTEIEESAREGFILLLVTENSENNDWIKKEIEYATFAGGKIIPIYIGNATLDCAWDYSNLRELQGFHLDCEPTKEQIEAIISDIEHRITFYNSDFTMSYGFQSAKSIQYPFVASIQDYTFWDCNNLETVHIPSSVSYISDLAFRENQDVLIICRKGSYAEQYCIRRNIRYRTES